MCQQSSYLVLAKLLIFIKKMTLQAIIKDNPHSQVFMFLRMDGDTETHSLPVGVCFPRAADGSALSSCFQAARCVGGSPLSARPPKADVKPWGVMPVVLHDEHVCLN